MKLKLSINNPAVPAPEPEVKLSLQVTGQNKVGVVDQNGVILVQFRVSEMTGKVYVQTFSVPGDLYSLDDDKKLKVV